MHKEENGDEQVKTILLHEQTEENGDAELLSLDLSTLPGKKEI